MSSPTIILMLRLMDLAILAATVGYPAIVEYRKHRAKIEEMLDEGREPTPQELQDINDDIVKLQAELHS